MGIQGLTGLLDNSNISLPLEDSRVRDINKYKYIYFDFQSLIYTVFNYIENIINYQFNLVNEIKNIDRNKDDERRIYKLKLHYALLNTLKEQLNGTVFGNLLYKFQKNVYNIQTKTSKIVNEDLTGVNLLYDTTQTYTNIAKIDKLEDALKQFKRNQNNHIKLIIIDNVKNILDKFHQLQECVIVFDGKPNFAKMIEQVKRRATTSIINKMKNNIKDKLVSSGVLTNLPEEIFFDRSMIGSHSPLMRELIDDFRSLTYKNSLNIPLTITVIDSEEGEGEHIINNHILNKVSTLPYTNDDKFLYYSPDGDVALLTMILNIKIKEIDNKKNNIVDLIRLESIDFNSYKFSYEVANKINLYQYANDEVNTDDNIIAAYTNILNQLKLQLYFVSIIEFQNYLLKDINTILSKAGKSLRKRTTMLKQYIVLISFFGNDFIPKILSRGIGDLVKFIQLYNNYLLNNHGQEFIDYLDGKKGIDESKFKFILKLHEYQYNQHSRTLKPKIPGKITQNEKDLNIDVFYDFLKLIINYTDDGKHDENQLIIKVFNKETGKSGKNFNDFVNGFLNKSLLLCTSRSLKIYNFLTSLLEANYYIDLDNLLLDGTTRTHYQACIDEMIHLVTKNRTPEEEARLNALEIDYYTNILYNKTMEYLDYYENPTLPNPTLLSKSDIKTNPPKTKLVTRRVPFNEIIHFNTDANAEECTKKYIEGFQYISDLYFTLNVDNKCWGYQCENAPTILSLINYLNTRSRAELDTIFNYNNVPQKFDEINHQLTKDSNMTYIINLRPAKYYLIDDIFHCENVRYVNKCGINGDMTILPFDNSGNFINIIARDYNRSPTNTKLSDTLRIAQNLITRTQPGGYKNKYLKYKMKYLKLKKLI